MAGHRTPVPRIQSEPRAARPSAAASVLLLDFGSHHMEDDNLKSELEVVPIVGCSASTTFAARVASFN